MQQFMDHEEVELNIVWRENHEEKRPRGELPEVSIVRNSVGRHQVQDAYLKTGRDGGPAYRPQPVPAGVVILRIVLFICELFAEARLVEEVVPAAEKDQHDSEIACEDKGGPTPVRRKCGRTIQRWSGVVVHKQRHAQVSDRSRGPACVFP